MEDKKRNIENELYSLMKNGEKGTVQDFCEKLEYDNEAEIAALLAKLEDDGKAKVLRIKRVHEGDGFPVYQGVYGLHK